MPAVKVALLSRGDAQLKAFVERLKTGVPVAMQAVAAVLHENAVASFRTQTDPYGKKWEAPSSTTLVIRAYGFHLAGPRLSKTKKRPGIKQVLKKITNAKALVDKGTLLSSLSPKSTARTATVTTNVPYAGVQQFGNPDNRIPNVSPLRGGNPAPIPARAFFPIVDKKVALPEAVMSEVTATLRDALLGKG